MWSETFGRVAREPYDRSSIGAFNLQFSLVGPPCHQPPCRLLCRLRAYLISHVSILTGASSPVSRLATAFAEHKLNEVQAFGYDEAIHRLEPFGTAEAFVEFLRLPYELLPEATKKRTFTFDKFVAAANAMADSMHKRECLLSRYLAFLDDV